MQCLFGLPWGTYIYYAQALNKQIQNIHQRYVSPSSVAITISKLDSVLLQVLRQR